MEKFGQELKRYFAERGCLNVELLIEKGGHVPKQYTLNPETYRNNELVDLFNPEKISALKLLTDSEIFSEKQFDLFFNETFPQTYAAYEKQLK